MPVLAREQASDCSNPALDIFFSVSGLLTDVSSLEYQIFDISTPIKKAFPVQVYPAVVGEWAEVNIDELCPVGQKIGTGHYVALYTPGATEDLGDHRVVWRFRLTPSLPEQSSYEEFQVLGAPLVTCGLYCSVSDIRAEGVTDPPYSDAHIANRILVASRRIDAITGQFFEARELELDFDGTGGVHLLLDTPIVAIEEVDYVDEDGAETVMDSDEFKVYNRHLTQGLVSPDDRANPKLTLVSSAGSKWTKGRQNVRVKGWFGYTEPDGSVTGCTPSLIREACKLLVIGDLPLYGDTGSRDDAEFRNRVIKERTLDQSYELQKRSTSDSGGMGSGNEQVDTILAMFRRPIRAGAV